MRHIIHVFALAVALAPALALAEPMSLLGKRVRLTTSLASQARWDPTHAAARSRTSDGRFVIGRVVAADDQSLTLTLPGKADSVRVREEEIATMEVSAGRRSRGRGALIGAGLGMGFGALMGFALGDDPPNQWFGLTSGQKAVAGAVLLTPLGALFGLIVPPSERWREVTTGRVGVGLTSIRGGQPAVAVSLRF